VRSITVAISSSSIVGGLPARFVQQAFDAVVQKPPPPPADGMLVNAELGSHGLARNALSALKNDPAVFRQ
jgi:hypothetical protein